MTGDRMSRPNITAMSRDMMAPDNYFLPIQSQTPGTTRKQEEEMPQLRQSVMILYLSNSALDSGVKGWTFYDGTGKERHTTGDRAEPPYANGMEALLDGWRVIQFPQLIPPYPDTEYTTSFQKHEFIFEKLEEIET